MLLARVPAAADSNRPSTISGFAFLWPLDVQLRRAVWNGEYYLISALGGFGRVSGKVNPAQHFEKRGALLGLGDKLTPEQHKRCDTEHR